MPPELPFSPELIEFDKTKIWHPYTSLTNPLPTYPIDSAIGTKVRLGSGKELIDGMSSWWTAIHGYNVPELNEAAIKQMKLMSHFMFGGATHKPAIELAQLLIDITPSSLDKIFFSDSGSVSVEVAMKMAVQYQHSLGYPDKKKFMTIKGGYHGDTTGAMSVCDPENGMHHLFSDFLPQHFFFDLPAIGFTKTDDPNVLKNLKIFFELHAKDSAAFILEPIVQGAGGMRFYSPAYLEAISSLCKKHQILLIADEIATGFGRTGKLFACEHAGVFPDIMCIGKALTGGYLSLAATLCTTEVANTICEGEAGVFMHGPTFMANPLACAIALASTKLLLSHAWEKKIKKIERQLTIEFGQAKKIEVIKEARVLGAIGVIELKQNVNVSEAQKFFVEKGVWIRPFRNLIYIMPPYIINEEELSTLTNAMLNYCKQLPLQH